MSESAAARRQQIRRTIDAALMTSATVVKLHWTFHWWRWTLWGLRLFEFLKISLNCASDRHIRELQVQKSFFRRRISWLTSADQTPTDRKWRVTVGDCGRLRQRSSTGLVLQMCLLFNEVIGGREPPIEVGVSAIRNRKTHRSARCQQSSPNFHYCSTTEMESAISVDTGGVVGGREVGGQMVARAIW